jgi:hypothetical protein
VGDVVLLRKTTGGGEPPPYSTLGEGPARVDLLY